MKMVLIFSIIINLGIILTLNTDTSSKKLGFNFDLNEPQNQVLYVGSNFQVNKKIARLETFYTQGMFFDDQNTLIESGGLYGESVLIKMDYPSLKIKERIKLDRKFFAEGIAKCGNKIYQLTWQERKVLQYSYPDFKLISTLNMDSNIREGWGLASLTAEQLVATDGSNKIYVLDCADNLSVINTLTISDKDGRPLDRINALTVVNGLIYANRYYDSNIYQIDPNTQRVSKTYNFQPLEQMEFDANTLTSRRLNSGDVLNGIAYLSSRNIFVITGKKWGHYYEVNLY